MTDLQAVFLGAIQGATEWLPISSTAHLRIVPALMGMPDPGSAFTAVSQLGTLLAALVYFWKDILGIVTGKSYSPAHGEQVQADKKLLIPIVIGTIPVVVCGLLFKKAIKGDLRSLYVVAISLIVFAILLGVAEAVGKRNRTIDDVTNRDGIGIGLMQAMALIPGASRSGTTMTAAMFLGLDRATAARFSFLLSLPAVFAAGLYELKDVIKPEAAVNTASVAEVAGWRPTLIATIVAFVVGLATIDWLIKFLRKNSTYAFIIYRVVLGLVILGLLNASVLKPL